MNLIEVGNLTEEQALTYLEKIRWPNGSTCPHCQSQDCTRMEGKTVRSGLHQCNNAECREQFTFRIDTIFEDSHLSCKQWVLAFHLMCSSKKGVSAMQLSRELGVSYKTAWHLAHRIRHAMTQEPLAGLLAGVVEVDETYVGGKPRKGTGTHKRGRGTAKAPVVVLVERGGRAKAKPLATVTGKNLKEAIRESVDTTATIMTDELPAYRGIGKEFEGGHKTVNHSRGEYARGDVSTNGAESFFALLKRGVNGVFHHVSKQHLHRYCEEFAFRWSERKSTDGQRTVAAIRGAKGKRLMYRAPVDGLTTAEMA